MRGKISDHEIECLQRYLEAIDGHHFVGMPVDLVLFRTPLDPFEGPHEHDLGWRHVTTGRVIVEPVQGTHISVMTAAGCQELARRFEPYLMQRVSFSGNRRSDLAPRVGHPTWFFAYLLGMVHCSNGLLDCCSAFL
jgi:hypothetical protein